MKRRGTEPAAKDVGRIAPGRKAPVHVSNHALFRWLERSGVIEVEALRASLSMALDRAYQAGAAMHQGEFLILAGGMVYVIRDGTVVTCSEDNGSHANLVSRAAGHGE